MSGGWDQSWDPFRELHREVGRLFESIEPLLTRRVTRPFPPVNFLDAGDRYLLTVQLPGIAPEDVDLSIAGEALTIQGERKRAEGVPDESYRRQERVFGKWSRTLNLPDRIDGGRVTAAFAQGILTVVFPKAEASKPRQINIAADAAPDDRSAPSPIPFGAGPAE